jgi:transketolase
VAYSGTNVKVIGISGGVSYGALGTSHHSLHDLAVMRALTGINVYLPADRFQTEKLTRYLAHTKEAAYVRVGRDPVPDVYTPNDVFIPGKANILTEGNDVAIIAAGETVYHALQAYRKIKERWYSCHGH